MLRQTCLEDFFESVAHHSQAREALIGLYYNWAIKETTTKNPNQTLQMLKNFEHLNCHIQFAKIHVTD